MSGSSAWTGASPHINKSELMCKTGCGYYGNPTWDGHCSKCFKDVLNKKQKRPVFDPTHIKNKVSRSVSDVTELPSKATSLMSRKLDQQQIQIGKKTKIVKDIFRISHSPKAEPSSLPQQSYESRAVYDELQSFLKAFCEDANVGVSKRIKLFVEKICKIANTTPVDDLGDIFHEFYSTLSSFWASNSSVWRIQDEDILGLTELVEKYVTTRLFTILSTNVHAYCEEKDLSLQKRIRSLMWVTCRHLECKIDESVNENGNLFDEVINVLIEIDSRRTPSAKLSFLVSASNQILFLLKKSCSGTLASADDFLPALIYCILKANPPLLQSNICYITNFALESSLQTGEAGYFFTNLCCAVSFIEKLTADSLGLSDVEFEHFMSGNSLPAKALEQSYLCDAFKIMEKNIENMSVLEKRMDSVFDGYNSIVSDMEGFKANFASEIDAALDRTPLTIKPREVNIDEPVPIQESLPPPLEPQSINDERSDFAEVELPVGNNKPSEASSESWSFQNSNAEDLDMLFNTNFSDNVLQPKTGSKSFGSESSSFDYLDTAWTPFKVNKCVHVDNITKDSFQSPVRMSNSELTSFTLQGETIQSISCSTGFKTETTDPFSPIQNNTSEPFFKSANSCNLPPPLLPITASPMAEPNKESTNSPTKTLFI